jgi:hypothetical protein
MSIASIDNIFAELGGHRMSGFGENAFDIPSPEWLIKSKKGLDNVAWLKQSAKAQELIVKVNFQADSKSVLVLKGFEKTEAVVPFRFEWEELGIFIEALDAVVQETGGLKVGTDMPEIGFEIKIKNFVEIKGL